MSDAPRSSAHAPAFFLETDAGTAPALSAEDERHAVRVLRLAAGDALLGLDGRGGRQPLRVRAVAAGKLQLEHAGEASTDPAPGEEGAGLPWFELAIAWPRRNRVEDMLTRLVQLGAAAIRPIDARQRGPQEVPETPGARTLRVLREACKQSGRTWLPCFEPVLTPAQLVSDRPEAACTALDPDADLPFDAWLRSLLPSPAGLGTRTRPIVLAIGPEGGWSADEREAFRERGVALTWLGPHVLRVETAAEAAMAVAAAVHGRAGRSGR